MMRRFKFVDTLGGTAALGTRLEIRGLEPLGRLRLSSRLAPLVLFIPSFAAPPPVRGFKFVDLLGDTEVVTPFYLVGRAGVDGQCTGKGHAGRAKVPRPHFRGVCVPEEIDSVFLLCFGGHFFRSSINQKLPKVHSQVANVLLFC